MLFRPSVLRLTATVGAIFIVAGVLIAPPAWAEDAAIAAGPAAIAVCEASIDASNATGGTLHVTVTAHGLAGGHSLWRCPMGVTVTPGDVHLVDASGIEAAISVEGTALAADIPAGDWTLGYDLAVTGPAPGSPFVITPAECLLLPTDSGINLAITPPGGWTALSNLPSASQNMDGFRLRTTRFLLSPDGVRIIARIGLEPAQVAIVALGGEVACPNESLAPLKGAVGAFLTTVAPATQEPVYVFLPAGGSPDELASEALDGLWAVHGTRATAGAGQAAQTMIDDSVWPLLRATLLSENGCPADTAIARRICEQWRRLRETQSPGAPALAISPLASLYFVARELAGGAHDLQKAVAAVCGAAGQSGSGDFTDMLAAALAADGSAAGLSASGLLLRLAGRTPDTITALPDLPDELLASGDPDSDDDGLPDRIDPAPNERAIAIIVGGRTVRLDVPPLNINGRIMVPLRFLAERLGLSVDWNAAVREALISRSGYEARFPIGTHYYLTNGQTHYLDAPAIIEGGRTLVSLRFVARALDVAVTWDGVVRTVSVTPGQPYSEEAVPPVAGRMAYLTFDDGPEPSMTPKILAVLKAYQVKATFFVLGGVAAGRGDLLRQIIAEGNGLGNHSYSHVTSSKSEYFLYRSPEAYLSELEACDRVIAAATGLHPCASRPPGGSYPYVTEEFRKLLRANGYLTYDWDTSAADSALPRPTIEQVLINIMAGARGGKRQRLIILMHDGGREHQSTLAALPAVIEYLRICGYDFGILPGAGTAVGAP